MKRNTIRIHSKSHLHNGVWASVLFPSQLTEFILAVDLKVEVRDVIIDGSGVASVLLGDLSVQIPLTLLSNCCEVRKGSVDIHQAKIKALKVAMPFFIGLLLRARREQSRDHKQDHDGIRVVLKLLMPSFVSEKPIEAEFVIDF